MFKRWMDKKRQLCRNISEAYSIRGGYVRLDYREFCEMFGKKDCAISFAFFEETGRCSFLRGYYSCLVDSRRLWLIRKRRLRRELENLEGEIMRMSRKRDRERRIYDGEQD